MLDRRDALWSAGQLDDPSFDAAWQFARADKIVIAAPFWDLSYPAILKIYLERISVCDITFGYDAAGNSIGLSRAGKQLLITTRGGNFSLPETAWMESGARHLKALCAMYGIPEFRLLCAEGLDDVRSDKEAILARAMTEAEALALSF